MSRPGAPPDPPAPLGPRAPRPAALLLAVTLCTSAVACTSAGAPPVAPPRTSRPSRTDGGASSSPASPASCVDAVFEGLTEPQRVGQLFALGLADDRLGPDEIAAIRTEHVGSVWFTATTSEGADAVRAVADAVQAQATPRATGRVGFFVAANQEGGQIQALRGTGFSTIPSALDQGTVDPAVLRRDAVTWGRELLAAGVNLDFAPVMDVVPPGTDARNQPIGALQREYGHDPGTVAAHGTAFLRGMSAAGVATTAKHFPGLGRVTGNTDDVAAVTDTETTPTDPSLRPFRAASDAGVPLVMVALATYTRIDPAHLAVFSPVVMRLLRGSIGFTGVIASDDLGGATAVADVPPADRALDFLSAGGDLVVSKTVDATDAMAEAVLDRASIDPGFMSRVDDAARHVLAAKDEAGLLPCSAG